MEVAIALMCPGVPVIDWAIIQPWVSNMPQARSWLSRTIMLKAVRIRVSCCSLATASSRLQSTSKVTGSITVSFIGETHDHIQSLVDPGAPSLSDNERCFTLLHDCRTGEGVAGF